MKFDLHPREQRTCLGHHAAQEQLRQAFHSNAMPPVWLLHGERGIGKATLAYAMAREILTSNGQDKSIVTSQMTQGSYPNFLGLERAPNEEGKIAREITVEESRKVWAFLRQHAAIPGWRVVIIDAVNEMNRNASNALLKILEEPPAQTVFFLIAHSLGQVLPTIRSRACKLQLFPLSDEELGETLGAKIPPEILPLAKGSIGRAIALQEAGGMTLLRQILHAIAGSLKGDWRLAQELVAPFDKDSPHYEILLDLLVWTLQRLILTPHLPLPQTPEDEKFDLLLKRKNMTHWVDVYERVTKFLNKARTSHLDRGHVVMALFFMIENPTIGDEFIYESF